MKENAKNLKNRKIRGKWPKIACFSDRLIRWYDAGMEEKKKNPAAVELGRLGGKARAAALTAARRAEISRLAVMSRNVHKGWPKGKKRTAV